MKIPTRDRCETCDREIATLADWEADQTEGLCAWGSVPGCCGGPRMDWRARAIAAEADNKRILALKASKLTTHDVVRLFDAVGLRVHMDFTPEEAEDAQAHLGPLALPPEGVCRLHDAIRERQALLEEADRTIDGLRAEVARLRALLLAEAPKVERLRMRHRSDGYIACPSSEFQPFGNGICRCAAGEHNRLIDEIAAALRAAAEGK